MPNSDPTSWESSDPKVGSSDPRSGSNDPINFPNKQPKNKPQKEKSQTPFQPGLLDLSYLAAQSSC